jgi:PAS domain S-box-containing protein
MSVLGLLAVFLAEGVSWGAAAPLWLPAVGLALALTFWLGPWFAGLAALGVLAGRLVGAGPDAVPAWADAAVTGGELALAWWWYVRLAGGTTRLEEPRSATLYLLLVPGAAAGLGAAARAALAGADDIAETALRLWLPRALSELALAPPLLLTLTPWLKEAGLAPASDPPDADAWPEGWSFGSALEVAGLAVGAGILGLLLAARHAARGAGDWHLWGVLLLLVVWAGLRQGLRGSTVTAGSASLLALAAALFGPGLTTPPLPLQGNLVSLCSAALVVGASVGWVRASEGRYRQAVAHIPVVLYSGRLLRPPAHGVPPLVRVVLVSPACRQVFGCAPEALLGPYENWLERVHPNDRELALAALTQLYRQREPVTYEYRLTCAPPAERWVRDTLAPRYDEDGQLLGWDGVLEDITEQRTLSYSLRRTTNMLHALVANLPTGVFFVQGATGLPVLVNARARQLLGQREDPSADITHFPRVYRLHRADGSPVPWEELPVARALRESATVMRDDLFVHRADGQRVPLVTWAAPVSLGGSGPPDGAVWVFEDLAALHQAEAARLDSEARLRAVIETMAEGLLVQDEAGRVIEWNPAACAILGVAPAAMPRRDGLGSATGCLREDGTALPPEEQPDRLCLHARAPVRSVVMGVPVADSLRWILVNALPLTQPGKQRGIPLLRVVTTFADITAYRQAQEVLRASEEKYRTLVEALPLMLVQLDRAGRITYCNPATRPLVSDRPEGPGGFWDEFVHPDDLPAVRALYEQVLRGEPARAEFRFRPEGGSEKTGYVLATPLGHGGTVTGSTLLIVDLTLQRRLEQELNRVQRLDLVGRLASGIVHDFNNLLTVVLGLAHQAEEGLPPEHPVADDLHRIQDAAEEAGRLAGQLLTFSKQRRVELRPVPLVPVVRRALKLLHGSLPPNIRLDTFLGSEEMEVLADEGQLQQILMNLCLNARDVMPEGGLLTVRTEPAGPVASSGSDNGSAVRTWVRLTVQDSGMGMEAAVRAQIFDPFFTTKERGTGLGLAVVRQLVESFSGRIEVWSEPGRGTRFDVWLPACEGEGAPEKGPG